MQNRLFIFFLFLSILINPLNAQDESESHSEKISSIEITGLKRTNLNVAKSRLEKFIGMDKSVYNENEAFALIKNTGALEPVSSEFIETEEGLVLHFTVLEKWSIFPVPIFFADAGDMLFGLFLFDANAFGMLDSLAAGGMYSSDSWSVVAMYNHTPNSQGVPGWSAFFMYGNQTEEYVNSHDKKFRVFNTESVRITFGLNYALTDLITSSARIIFNSISLTDDKLNPPDGGAMHIGINPRISLSHSTWDGILLSDKSISAEYYYYIAVKGDSYHQVEYRGNLDLPFFPGFRANVKSAGVWKSTDDSLFEEGPQAASVGILPRNYSAIYYAGLSAGLEKYILKNRWGTLSIHGAWQCVFSGNDIFGMDFNHGPFGGIVFYLSRIALPAVSTGLGYNVTTGLYQFNFSIGMSF